MTEPSQYFKGRTVQEQMDEVIGYVDTRAAEVATTAIASDVAQVHQDMLDADADATAAAASAAAAAGTLANAVKKTGEASQSIAGDIAVAGDLTGGTVTVPTPVNNTDAASKKYVDDQDALDAKLTGATFTGQLNASGQRAYTPENTTDVATIGTLDAYTPMVRTTGNQTIQGIKSFTNANIDYLVIPSTDGQRRVQINRSDDDLNVIPSTNQQYPIISWNDKNGELMGGIYLSHNSNGTTSISSITRNSDKTFKYQVIVAGNVI